MTKEEAIIEIEKVFAPAFANYIITALTEGATVSDKDSTTKNDIRDNRVKNELEPTTKNDLEVDCIPRIEVIDYLCKHCPDDGECFKDCDEIKHLRNMPSVTPQEHRWIPVTERLPEEYLCNDGYVEPSDYVLVWGDHGNYGVSRYWGNRRSKSESPNTYKDWVDLDWVVQKPIAWMPLPKPYKGGQEE